MKTETGAWDVYDHRGPETEQRGKFEGTITWDTDLTAPVEMIGVWTKAVTGVSVRDLQIDEKYDGSIFCLYIPAI